MLPVPGEVLVGVGEEVEPRKVVARAAPPGKYRVIDVARALRVRDGDVSKMILKGERSVVEADEVIAMRKGALPFLRRACRAPARGYIISVVGGLVLLETESTLFNLPAFVAGRVVEVVEKMGVVIETRGTYIEGACGLGGEVVGVLQVLAGGREHTLLPDQIEAGAHGAIILAGGHLTEETARKAEHVKARGVVAGSIDASLLQLDPPLSISVVATEGFGSMPMSRVAFDLLQGEEGREVSVSGHTGDRVRPRKPLIVVPSKKGAQDFRPPLRRAEVGDRVRALRLPAAGKVGEIVLIPNARRVLPSGVHATGAVVDFEGEKRFVPWGNLEHI